MDYYYTLTRKQLQAECKKRGFPANKSNLQMAQFLYSSALKMDKNTTSEGQHDAPVGDDSKDEVPKRKKKQVRFSPEVVTREYEPSAFAKRGRSRKRMVNPAGNATVQVPDNRGKSKKETMAINGAPLRRSTRTGWRGMTEQFVDMECFPVASKRRKRGENMEDDSTNDKAKSTLVGMQEVDFRKDEVDDNKGVVRRQLRGREVVVKKNGDVGGGDSFFSGEMERGLRKRRKGKPDDEVSMLDKVSKANESLEEDTKCNHVPRLLKRIANEDPSALLKEQPGKAEIGGRITRSRAKVDQGPCAVQNRKGRMKVKARTFEAASGSEVVGLKDGQQVDIQQEEILKPAGRKARRRNSIAPQNSKQESDEPERRRARGQLQKSCLQVASEYEMEPREETEKISLPVVGLRRSRRNTIADNRAVPTKRLQSREAVERLKQLPDDFSGKDVSVSNGPVKSGKGLPEHSRTAGISSEKDETVGTVGENRHSKRRNRPALNREPPANATKSMVAKTLRRSTRHASTVEVIITPSEPYNAAEKKEIISKSLPVIEEATVSENISAFGSSILEAQNADQLSLNCSAEVPKINTRTKDDVDHCTEEMDAAVSLEETLAATTSELVGASIGLESSEIPSNEEGANGAILLEETVSLSPISSEVADASTCQETPYVAGFATAKDGSMSITIHLQKIVTPLQTEMGVTSTGCETPEIATERAAFNEDVMIITEGTENPISPKSLAVTTDPETPKVASVLAMETVDLITPKHVADDQHMTEIVTEPVLDEKAVVLADGEQKSMPASFVKHDAGPPNFEDLLVEPIRFTALEVKMDEQLCLNCSREPISSKSKSRIKHESNGKRRNFVDDSAEYSAVDKAMGSATLVEDAMAEILPESAGASPCGEGLEATSGPAAIPDEEGTPKLAVAFTGKETTDFVDVHTRNSAMLSKEHGSAMSPYQVAASAGCETSTFASEPATINKETHYTLLLEENLAPGSPNLVGASRDVEAREVASDPPMVEETVAPISPKLVGASTGPDILDTLCEPGQNDEEADTLGDNEDELASDDLFKADIDCQSSWPLKNEVNFDDCSPVKPEEAEWGTQVQDETSDDGLLCANAVDYAGLWKRLESEQSILYSTKALQIFAKDDGVSDHKRELQDIAADMTCQDEIPSQGRTLIAPANIAIRGAGESCQEESDSTSPSLKQKAPQVVECQECLFDEGSFSNAFDLLGEKGIPKLLKEEEKDGGAEECLKDNGSLYGGDSSTISTIQEDNRDCQKVSCTRNNLPFVLPDFSADRDMQHQGENQPKNQQELSLDDNHIVEGAVAVLPPPERVVPHASDVVGFPNERMNTLKCKVESSELDRLQGDVLPQFDLEQLQDEKDDDEITLGSCSRKVFLDQNFEDNDPEKSISLEVNPLRHHDKKDLMDESTSANCLDLQSGKLHDCMQITVAENINANDLTDILANTDRSNGMDGESTIEHIRMEKEDFECAVEIEMLGCQSDFQRLEATVGSGLQSSCSQTIFEDGEASGRRKEEIVMNSLHESLIVKEYMVNEECLEGESNSDHRSQSVREETVELSDHRSYEADASLTLSIFQESECFIENSAEPQACTGEESKLLVKGSISKASDLNVDSFAEGMKTHAPGEETLEARKTEATDEARLEDVMGLVMQECGSRRLSQLNDLEESGEVFLKNRDEFLGIQDAGSSSFFGAISADGEELDKTTNSAVDSVLDPETPDREVGVLERKNLLELGQNAFFSSEELTFLSLKGSQALNYLDRMEGGLHWEETESSADTPLVTSNDKNCMSGDGISCKNNYGTLKSNDDYARIDGRAEVAGSRSHVGKIGTETAEAGTNLNERTSSLLSNTGQSKQNVTMILSSGIDLDPSDSFSADATSDRCDRLLHGNSSANKRLLVNKCARDPFTEDNVLIEETHTMTSIDGYGEQSNDFQNEASEASPFNAEYSLAAAVVPGNNGLMKAEFGKETTASCKIDGTDLAQVVTGDIGAQKVFETSTQTIDGACFNYFVEDCHQVGQVQGMNASTHAIGYVSQNAASWEITEMETVASEDLGKLDAEACNDFQPMEVDCSNALAIAASQHENKPDELYLFCREEKQNEVKELDALVSFTNSTYTNAVNIQENPIAVEQAPVEAGDELQSNDLQLEHQMEQNDNIIPATVDIGYVNRDKEYANFESNQVFPEKQIPTAFSQGKAFQDAECDSNNLNQGSIADTHTEYSGKVIELHGVITKVDVTRLEASPGLLTSTVDQGNAAEDEKRYQLKVQSPNRTSSYGAYVGSQNLFAKKFSYSAVERKNQKTFPYKGSPHKVSHLNDMKENTQSIKRGEIGSMTELRMSKRRPLEDLK